MHELLKTAPPKKKTSATTIKKTKSKAHNNPQEIHHKITWQSAHTLNKYEIFLPFTLGKKQNKCSLHMC